MTDSKIGLYDSDGGTIIEYNQFDSTGVQFMYISTGFGFTGRWTISTPGKYFKHLVVTKPHEYRCH